MNQKLYRHQQKNNINKSYVSFLHSQIFTQDQLFSTNQTVINGESCLRCETPMTETYGY